MQCSSIIIWCQVNRRGSRLLRASSFCSPLWCQPSLLDLVCMNDDLGIHEIQLGDTRGLTDHATFKFAEISFAHKQGLLGAHPYVRSHSRLITSRGGKSLYPDRETQLCSDKGWKPIFETHVISWRRQTGLIRSLLILRPLCPSKILPILITPTLMSGLIFYPRFE